MRRLPRAPAAIAALALCAAALLAPTRARAAEHEWHAGMSFGYSALFAPTDGNGFGGGLHLAYGVSDMFNLLADVDAIAYTDAKWAVVSGGLGAASGSDVLQRVPWIGAEVGPAGIISTDPHCGLATLEPCHAFRLSIAAPFGVDYKINRSFAVGASGRVQVLLLGDSPWLTIGAFARAEYTWGF